MSAVDLLFGSQSSYTICLTFDGATYTNEAPLGGGDFDVRLRDGLLFTLEIPKPFQNATESSLGSIRAIHNNNHPFDIDTNVRGKEYTVELCGVINAGLPGEQVITFDDRRELTKGVMNSVSWSENNYLLSFGGNTPAMQASILGTVVRNGEEVTASEFDFSLTNATTAQDNGDITTTISTSSLTSASQTIEIDFSSMLTEVEISIDSVTSSDEVLRRFSFFEVSDTRVESSGDIRAAIEVSSLSGSVITVTLSFQPARETSWIFRDIDVETITNWSIEPASINPPFGEVNSVVTWLGLDSVSEITFDITKPGPNIDLLVPAHDPQTRPHIFNGVTSFKLWPTRLIESRPQPSSISWSPPPTTVTTSGVYRWSDVSLNSLTLSGTFPGTNGSNPLVMSVDGNSVLLQSDLVGANIQLGRVFKDSANDPDKISFEPQVLGDTVRNYQPLSLGGVDYNFGTNRFTDVRNDGVSIPAALTQSEFDSNQAQALLATTFQRVFQTLCKSLVS